MASIVENRKGFKIIKASHLEMAGIGGFCICDFCNSVSKKGYGYYIAVLNSYYCPECYEAFIRHAENHPEDRAIEEKNFKFYSNLLNVK